MTLPRSETSPRPPEQRRARRRIGEVLVEQGVLSQEQLLQVLEHQQDVPAQGRRTKLGALVVERGLATERQVAAALAGALDLRLVDLGTVPLVPEHVRSLPRTVAERCGVLVLERDGNRVVVAAVDPTDVVALDDVRLYTGAGELVVHVATGTQLREHLGRAWSLQEDAAGVSTLFEGLDDDVPEDDPVAQAVDAAPVVRLVDVVLADAVRARASDVHVEPQAGDLRIRYRVDGLLRDVMTVPRGAASAAVSRLKILSGLDIAERRRPQDGRARLLVDRAVVEARISTLPTLHGEKVVVRLLPRAEDVPVLARTGLTPTQLEAVGTALVQSQGLVLITGPTGSGKTGTLYAALSQVSTPDRNIVTLEDPVEVQVPGTTQVQVHARSGLTFAAGLRSVLRQDPDVVLVGEVRDGETAGLAVQAATTGHLVLTTLHTNSAVAAVGRLVDMGVEPYLVASALSLVVAQRLVRTPCGGCAAPYVPSPRTLALLGLAPADLEGATPVRGRGCAECGGTGYRGRTGVFEVLPVTAAVRRALLTSPTEDALARAARTPGAVTLRAAALAAAARGTTTYEEVLRATTVDAESGPTCPTCARALAEDMVACPYDGTPLGRDRCRGCERRLDAEWRTCPWCRADVVDAAPPRPASEPAGLPRLLVVEDDDGVRGFIAAALTGTVEVVGAADAATGLGLVGEGGIDAVLVDHGLPDLSGTELVRLLRADPRTLPLPVLMLTGSSSPAVELEARRAGADDFLAKPVEPLLLEERVLALLSRRSLALR